MTSYILRRLLLMVPVLIGASLVIFLALRYLPGDISDVILGGEEFSPEQQERIREAMGLNDPLPVQYARWFSHMVQGDLGNSMRNNIPVAETLLKRLPVSFEIALLSVLVSTLLAVPLGIVSAVYPDRWQDALARLLAMLGLSVPNFLIATLLILFTTLVWGWYTEPLWVNPFEDPVASAKQMLLPVLSLSTAMMAITMRMMRSSMLEVLRADYIRTARAKGLREWQVMVVHALKNAFIPVLTVIGLQLGHLMGGTIIIEQIFALPGVGWMLLQAVYSRDYTAVQGTVFFMTLLFALVNLVVDVLYVFLDPRIRLS